MIAPIVGLPPLPVIPFMRDATGRFTKFPTIARVVGDHPFVWLDDELTPAIHAWAGARRVPTWVVDVNPAIGLTYDMIVALRAFPNGV